MSTLLTIAAHSPGTSSLPHDLPNSPSHTVHNSALFVLQIGSITSVIWKKREEKSNKQSCGTLSNVRDFIPLRPGVLGARRGCRRAIGNNHCFCWVHNGVILIILPQRCVDILLLPLFILCLLLFLYICGGAIPYCTKCLLHCCLNVMMKFCMLFFLLSFPS